MALRSVAAAALLFCTGATSSALGADQWDALPGNTTLLSLVEQGFEIVGFSHARLAGQNGSVETTYAYLLKRGSVVARCQELWVHRPTGQPQAQQGCQRLTHPR